VVFQAGKHLRILGGTDCKSSTHAPIRKEDKCLVLLVMPGFTTRPAAWLGFILRFKRSYWGKMIVEDLIDKLTGECYPDDAVLSGYPGGIYGVLSIHDIDGGAVVDAI